MAMKKEMAINPNNRHLHSKNGKTIAATEPYQWQIRTFVIKSSQPMKPSEKQEELVDVMEAVETTDLMDLIVFNDDVNTFDHVIATLIRVCHHTPEQAEQCTFLIHYKGKCAVKSGSLEFLRPFREAICEAGIDARIL